MQVIDFYNNLATKTSGFLATGRFFSFSPFLHKHIFNNINKKIIIKDSDEVLDLGGGTGELTKYFSQICRRVTLADGAEKAIDVAKSKLKNFKNVEYVVADINRPLPFSREQFNKIICYSVAHYLKDMEKFNFLLEQLLLVCASKGLIFIGDIPLSEKYVKNLAERKKNSIANFLGNIRYLFKKIATSFLYNVKGINPIHFSSIKFTKEAILDVLKNYQGIECGFLAQDPRLPFANSREDLLIKKI
ncbi:MAG: class I SAM-dependent methyltransferase [Candidatus Staskawiczbacteria bacterium]|nr:class I SAM-dependent methyltransferase [Candidatus Staskawiczbacteria bacterium]